MIYIDKSLNVCDDFLEKFPMDIQDTKAELECDENMSIWRKTILSWFKVLWLTIYPITCSFSQTGNFSMNEAAVKHFVKVKTWYKVLN